MARFFGWWGSELAWLVPGFLRGDAQRGLRTLEVAVGGTHIVASLRRGARRHELGRIARNESPAAASDARDALLSGISRRFVPQRTRITVRVAAEQALTRTVELPAAATQNLRQVLSFEIHRLTPFKHEAVYFDGRVVERIKGGRQVRVILDVVPRGVIDEALELLAAWDTASDRRSVSIVRAGHDIFVSFLPQQARSRLTRTVNLVLLAVNLALLGAVVAIPLQRQHSELQGLREQVERAESAAAEAIGVRERLDRIRSESAYLVGQKNTLPTMVQTLDELSHRLPDTTWVNRLEVNRDEIRIAGYSAAASSLIGALDESDFLGDARFISPITVDPAVGRERFFLSARIVHGKADR